MPFLIAIIRIRLRIVGAALPSTGLAQLIFLSSTSKMRSEFGGMRPGKLWVPYAKSLVMSRRAFSPSFICTTPSSQPIVGR